MSVFKYFYKYFQYLNTCNTAYKSGTGYVWYRIVAPIRALLGLYSNPESGVHVTEMIIYDSILFNLPLATIPAIIIAATSANSSSTSLSATFIFSARHFHSRRMCYKKRAPENRISLWRWFLKRVSMVLIACIPCRLYCFYALIIVNIALYSCNKLP